MNDLAELERVTGRPWVLQRDEAWDGRRSHFGATRGEALARALLAALEAAHG